MLKKDKIRNIDLYLDDIKRSIKRIEKYTEKISFAQFSENEMLVDAVVRNFEVIGEATGKISDEIKKKNPEIPWKKIIGIRNKLIHEYFDQDLETIWQTIKKDLPEFKAKIKTLSK